MTIQFTPDQVRRYGLEPYAVYGGQVYSFKCSETGDRCYPIELLPDILAKAQIEASLRIDAINTYNGVGS